MAFPWSKEVEKFSDLSPCVFDSSWRCASHEVFELGEDLLDGIEIGAVGWQEDEVCAFGPDGLARRLSLMAAEIIEDDDISLDQGRSEHLLDIGGEDLAVDRSVDHPWCVDPVMAERCDEGLRLPMSEWHEGVEPLTFGAPASERSHVGLHPCLVDEDQAFGINLALMSLPAQALAGDVRSILLRWQDRFF